MNENFDVSEELLDCTKVPSTILNLNRDVVGFDYPSQHRSCLVITLTLDLPSKKTLLIRFSPIITNIIGR